MTADHETPSIPPALVDPGTLCAPVLAEILALVRERCGTDFGGYRASTVERRVQSGILAASAKNPAAYLARLRADPAEIDRLVDRLTINVSRFFRNATTFDVLRGLLAQSAAAVPAGEALRIWSAGCGEGEEAYSLAMLVSEVLGRAGTGSVCATDIDVRALEVARAARYSLGALADVPVGLRARYFVACPDQVRPHEVAGDVVSRVIFAQHDLTSAARPPTTGFHVVCCRNVLIYFRPHVQRHAQELLRASLAPGGLLCLGEAEWPCATLLPFLQVVDGPARIFRLRP